jgi:hypothetical protein
VAPVSAVMDQYFREMKTFREKTYEVIKAFEAWQSPASEFEDMEKLYDTFLKRMEDLKGMIK